MAENCKIEWVAELARQRGMASKSWNPVIGCSRASEGCRNCYAAGIAHRFGHHGAGVYAGLTGRDGDGTPRFNGKIDFSEKRLKEPLRWRKPAVVFAGDMADIFHNNVTDAMLDRIFAVMALRPDHLFLVLTKRPERMRAYLSDKDLPYSIRETDEWRRVDSDSRGFDDGAPLPNVWLGVTAEDQATADARTPHLLATPAAKRFVSIEPMLGPVDLRRWMPNSYECTAACGYRSGRPPEEERCAACGWQGFGAGEFCPICGRQDFTHVCPDCGEDANTGHPDTPVVNWVICGGESGPNARPMHPDWARALRDQCVSARVPFFFKQWGESGHGAVRISTGEPIIREFTDFQQWVNKASTWVNGGTCVDTAGRICEIGGDMMRARDERAFPVAILHKIGKKAAGRLLDGRIWDEVPQ